MHEGSGGLLEWLLWGEGGWGVGGPRVVFCAAAAAQQQHLYLSIQLLLHRHHGYTQSIR